MTEFLSLMEGWEGFQPVRKMKLNESALAKVVDLLSNADGNAPHRHRYLLQEAITTSDFPALFGGVLDRQLLARYKAATPEWRSYIPVGGLVDFRQAEYHKVQGNDTRLARVPEKSAYPIAPMSNAHYHRQVFKYGRQFDISWEALVNDSMGAFSDMPERFADAALAAEAWEATGLYCSAAGPNAALFGAPIADVDGANVTNLGVLGLTIANLQTTLGLMAMQQDVNGRPIGASGVHLVVPPALKFTGLQILTSALVQYVDAGAGAGIIPLPTTNVMSLREVGLQLHVDPNLAVMDLVAPNTTWYVFADAAQGKSMQMDFLRGAETPEICAKSSDKMTLTGTPLSPFSGDFETDDVLWRVRHCFGGARMDPRFAYAQVGP